MILACGTCTHWIVWTAFPGAAPWAVTFAVWFLFLSAVSTLSRTALVGVPRLAVAAGLVLGSVILAVVIAGPVAGLWFAPSCLLGTASAVRLASSPTARRMALCAAAVAVVLLGALWARSAAAHRRLGPEERVLLLESTPAWPIELRRVGRGDCAALASLAERASAQPLAAKVEQRLAQECPGSTGQPAPSGRKPHRTRQLLNRPGSEPRRPGGEPQA